MKIAELSSQTGQACHVRVPWHGRRVRNARHVLEAMVAVAGALCVAACALPPAAPAGATPSDTASASAPPASSDSPGAVLVARRAADALYDRADWRAAAAAYERLVALSPRHAVGWLRLGNCRMRLGDLDAAARAFEQAATADGSDGRAAFNLALVRITQAEAALRQARQPGVRLGALSGEARRMHELTRWLASPDRAEATAP